MCLARLTLTPAESLAMPGRTSWRWGTCYPLEKQKFTACFDVCHPSNSCSSQLVLRVKIFLG
eukprot:6935150-Karenia_brevis.AAC.1